MMVAHRVPRLVGVASILAGWGVLAAGGCVHGRPEPLVSRGGHILLINATSEDMEVFANGDIVARVPRGQEVHVDRLRLGSCRFEAVGTETQTRLRTDIVLEEGRVPSWRMDETEEQRKALATLPRGAIRARNQVQEPVRVFVDGSPREMIWPGSEVEYGGIRYGKHHLRAVGVKSGFALEQEVMVDRGVVPLFDIRQPEGFLELRNETAWQVVVTVASATVAAQLPGVSSNTVLRLDPGESRTVRGLAPGAASIAVRDTANRPVYETTVLLTPGEVSIVSVPSPTGVLAVVSYLDQAVTILADGRPLGMCDANGAAEFQGLAPGSWRLQAVDGEGNLVARVRLDIPSQGQGVWMVRPGGTAETGLDEGAILVVNRRPEPIRLRVNGFDRGEAPAGGRRLVPSLPPGPHEVAVLGVRSGEVFRADIQVEAGRTVTWETRPSVAILALRNLRDEPVRLLMDEEEIAFLAPSESTEVRVPAGRHRLEARGTASLKASIHDVDLPASARIALDLSSPTASVTLTNRHSDSLEIRVGDRELGVVGPGERVTFRHLEPGTVPLIARSLTRPLRWAVTVVLTAGQTYEWDLSP